MDWQNVTLSELKESMKEVDLKVGCSAHVRFKTTSSTAEQQVSSDQAHLHNNECCVLHLVQLHSCGKLAPD